MGRNGYSHVLVNIVLPHDPKSTRMFISVYNALLTYFNSHGKAKDELDQIFAKYHFCIDKDMNGECAIDKDVVEGNTSLNAEYAYTDKRGTIQHIPFIYSSRP